MDKNDQVLFLHDHKLGCAEAEELLDGYLEEELEPGLVQRFDQHLTHCDACRTLVDDCRQILSLAKTLRDLPLPPGVGQRLRLALSEKVGYISPRPRLRVFPGRRA